MHYFLGGLAERGVTREKKDDRNWTCVVEEMCWTRAVHLPTAHWTAVVHDRLYQQTLLWVRWRQVVTSQHPSLWQIHQCASQQHSHRMNLMTILNPCRFVSISSNGSLSFVSWVCVSQRCELPAVIYYAVSTQADPNCAVSTQADPILLFWSHTHTWLLQRYLPFPILSTNMVSCSSQNICPRTSAFIAL